jgi:hypothetical protein
MEAQQIQRDSVRTAENNNELESLGGKGSYKKVRESTSPEKSSAMIMFDARLDAEQTLVSIKEGESAISSNRRSKHESLQKSPT